MASEGMSLSWTKFSETAENAFRDLGSSGDFSDVTLAGADGQLVEAHRVILSSCSPVLKTILLKISNSHPVLYMKGMNIEDISLLLKFVYTGEVTLEKENLESFLETANELQIAGLVKPVIKDTIAEPDVVQAEDKVEKESLKSDNHLEVKEPVKVESDFDSQPQAANNHGISCEHPGCEKEFSTTARFRSHSRAIHEGIIHACSYCAYTTGFPSNLKRHNLKAHEDDQSIDGSTSSPIESEEKAQEEEIFDLEEPLDSNETKSEKKRVLCRECGKEFASNQNLNIHTKAVHELVKYPCDDCGHQSTNKSNLKSHKKKKHTT